MTEINEMKIKMWYHPLADLLMCPLSVLLNYEYPFKYCRCFFSTLLNTAV